MQVFFINDLFPIGMGISILLLLVIDFSIEISSAYKYMNDVQ